MPPVGGRRHRENSARPSYENRSHTRVHTAIAPTGTLVLRIKARREGGGGQRRRVVPAVGSWASETPRSHRQIRPTASGRRCERRTDRGPSIRPSCTMCSHPRRRQPSGAQVAAVGRRA
uniref:Uncharacterized protein n=1 Tax=Plectus sambesii TaxID=2011161 RepID=A0A914X7Q9_9BILA